MALRGDQEMIWKMDVCNRCQVPELQEKGTFNHYSNL